MRLGLGLLTEVPTAVVDTIAVAEATDTDFAAPAVTVEETPVTATVTSPDDPEAKVTSDKATWPKLNDPNMAFYQQRNIA